MRYAWEIAYRAEGVSTHIVAVCTPPLPAPPLCPSRPVERPECTPHRGARRSISSSSTAGRLAHREGKRSRNHEVRVDHLETVVSELDLASASYGTVWGPSSSDNAPWRAREEWRAVWSHKAAMVGLVARNNRRVSYAIRSRRSDVE